MLAVVFSLSLPQSALGAAPESENVAVDQNVADTSHLTKIKKLRQALVRAIDEGPLVFKRVLLVTSPPVRFGEYSVREGHAFASGEALHIYVEPLGLVWKEGDDGQFGLECEVDFGIENAEGAPIVKETKFGRLRLRNHERISEVMTFLTLTISGAPLGQLVVVVTYRDVHSSKQATFRLPFEVNEPSLPLP